MSTKTEFGKDADRAAVAAPEVRPDQASETAGTAATHATPPAKTAGSTGSASLPRVSLFGIQINPLTMTQAVQQVYDWIERDSESVGRQGAMCRFVVTPNVDHVVMLQSDSQLRAAYEDASLVLADGWPVVRSAAWLQRRLTERVAGSDLVPAIFTAAATLDRPLRVFLLGAGPGVAERAAAQIAERWPQVHPVGTYSPPLGFECDEKENRGILQRVASCAPDLLVIGLGAPKQELWVHRHRAALQTSAALCVGATIDFLAGEKARAPRWVQQAGLEWLHRVASEPRRLARRYARDAWVFPQLVWREYRQGPR